MHGWLQVKMTHFLFFYGMNYDKNRFTCCLDCECSKKRSYVYFVSEFHKEKSLYIGH